MRSSSVLRLFALLCMLPGTGWAGPYEDWRDAHELMKKGDFEGANRLVERIKAAAKPSPRYMAQVSALPDPWKGICRRFPTQCELSYPSTENRPRLFSIEPVTDIRSFLEAQVPISQVLGIQITRLDGSTRGQEGLGKYTIRRDSLVLEYAGSRISAFQAKGCDARSNEISPADYCWVYYFRIPDEYAQKPFTVIVEGLGVTPALQHHTLVVPHVKFHFSIDTTPLPGALADAAIAGDTAEVKRLIAAGSNIYETQGAVNYTPMLHAAVKGHIDVMKALLEAGYDVNWQATTMASSLLNDALSKKAPLAAIELLLRHGAKTDILLCNNGCYSTIHLAMRPDAEEVIPLLVAYGADVNAIDHWGSPLWAAHRLKRPPYIGKVLEKVGGKMLPPNIQCSKEATAKFKTNKDGWERWCEDSRQGAAVMHGRYVAWRGDTTPRMGGEYRNGVRHGLWSTYDENGKRVALETIENGRLLRRLHYREDGKFARADHYGEKGELVRVVYYEGNNRIARDVHYEDGKEVLQR